jgi:hypothetical protein
MLNENSVHTSQETHYVPATKLSRLMFCCENQTEHTDTLSGHNAGLQYVKAAGMYTISGLSISNKNIKIQKFQRYKWMLL